MVTTRRSLALDKTRLQRTLTDPAFVLVRSGVAHYLGPVNVVVFLCAAAVDAFVLA